MTDKDCRYIENNLQLTNRELASKIGVSIYQVKHYLEQKNLRRTSEQLKQIFLQHGEDQRGARNPNWKGDVVRIIISINFVLSQRIGLRLVV